jgi:hypothetical protein
MHVNESESSLFVLVFLSSISISIIHLIDRSSTPRYKSFVIKMNRYILMLSWQK